MDIDAKPRRRQALSAMIAISLLAMLTGCTVDYEAPLIGEYRIIRTSANSIGVYGPMRTLARREGFVSLTSCYAGPLVDGIDVIDHLIVGPARMVEGSHGCSNPGYFVIDTATEEHWLELPKDEFDARCKSLGIVPVFKSPSQFRK
jgi:hypothetical protein